MPLDESTFSTHARKYSNLSSRPVVAAESLELCANSKYFILSFPLLCYRNQKNKSSNNVRLSVTAALPIAPKPIGLNSTSVR